MSRVWFNPFKKKNLIFFSVKSLIKSKLVFTVSIFSYCHNFLLYDVINKAVHINTAFTSFVSKLNTDTLLYVFL